MTESVRVPIQVGIQPGTKLLKLYYQPSISCWDIWLSHDHLIKYGTFLRLSQSGGMTRITLRPDGTEEIHVVKE
jgi:hypothetical protein